MSGSVPSVSSSFTTDFTGTITNGVYTASKHFSNQKYIKLNEFTELKPLGTTIELKPSSSIEFNGGKFFDDIYVYPPNHTYIVGSSRDVLNNLLYDGTQNVGGDIIESEAFTDSTEEAFYHILTTGADGFIIQPG